MSSLRPFLLSLVFCLFGVCFASTPAHAAGTCDYHMTAIGDKAATNNQPWSTYVPTYMRTDAPCEFDWQFSLTEAPSGMTIDNSGLVQWTPSVSQTETFTVTVRLEVYYTEPTVRTYTQTLTFHVTVCASADVAVQAALQCNFPGIQIGISLVNNSSICSQVASGQVVIDNHVVFSWSNVEVGPSQSVGVWSESRFDPDWGCNPFAYCGHAVAPYISNTLLLDPNTNNNIFYGQYAPPWPLGNCQ